MKSREEIIDSVAHELDTDVVIMLAQSYYSTRFVEKALVRAVDDYVDCIKELDDNEDAISLSNYLHEMILAHCPYKIKDSDSYPSEEQAELEHYFWEEELEKWVELQFD